MTTAPPKEGDAYGVQNKEVMTSSTTLSPGF